jgi:hypothetical protein
MLAELTKPSFNLQKALLFLVMLIAPFPFYLILFAGTAPILLVAYLFISTLISGKILGALIALIFLVIELVLAYLFVCLVYWVFLKISSRHEVRWLLTIIFCAGIIILSFQNSYVFGQGDGGHSDPKNIITVWDMVK